MEYPANTAHRVASSGYAHGKWDGDPGDGGLQGRQFESKLQILSNPAACRLRQPGVSPAPWNEGTGPFNRVGQPERVRCGVRRSWDGGDCATLTQQTEPRHWVRTIALQATAVFTESPGHRVRNLLEFRLARGLLLESRLARPGLLEMRLSRAILLEFRFASLVKRKTSRFSLAKRNSDYTALAKRKTDRTPSPNEIPAGAS